MAKSKPAKPAVAVSLEPRPRQPKPPTIAERRLAAWKEAQGKSVDKE